MSYVGLGSRPVMAAKDTTGLNPGNLTSAYPSNVLTSKVAYYEVYSMSVTGVPSLAKVKVFVGTRLRTTALLAGDSEWDSPSPILLTPTDELFLCWSIAATSGAQIESTIWMRYDPAIQPRPGETHGTH